VNVQAQVRAAPSKKLPWRCWWGFHRWTVWSAPVAGERHVLNFPPERVDVQERTCLRCNLKELRSL
jgi:hypothetical protein